MMARIVLPLLAPALVANFVLLFIIGFREFTLPMLLASRDNPVLSVVMWNLFAANETAAAAAVGSLILVCVAPVIFLVRHFLGDTT
jgi:iron(III) transport system permease protein